MIWVNKISEDWKAIRFKYIASVSKGKLPINQTDAVQLEDRIPYLSMEYLRAGPLNPNFVPEYLSPYGMVLAEEGDILLLWDGSNAGEFLRAKTGAVSSTIAIITPIGIDRAFLFWACKGLEPAVRSETIGMGIPHVNGEFLSNLFFPLPKSHIQNIITEFLNAETNKIDTLVSEKERMLSLLAEKRTALITRAVTRGLDPDVSLKPSGHEWLGDIPVHWKVKRSKQVLREHDERSVSGDEELMTVSHITGVTKRSAKEVNMFEAESNEGYKLCSSGNLVINTLWAWMGAMGIAWEPGIVSPAYHVYALSPELLPGYVDALVRIPVFAKEVTRFSKGVWSSRLRLYPEGLYEVRLPVPPLDEQQKIIDAIETDRQKTAELEATLKKSIELLKERRSALITAAVTGQIKLEANNEVAKA